MLFAIILIIYFAFFARIPLDKSNQAVAVILDQNLSTKQDSEKVTSSSPESTPLKIEEYNVKIEESESESITSADSFKVFLPSKKRKVNQENWKKNIKKTLINKGLAYYNKYGVEVPAKTIKEPCSLQCVHKCREKFSEEDRMEIFNRFYEDGNKVSQWGYIVNNVKTIDKKVKTPNSRRTCTKNYYLSMLNDPVESTQKKRVCQLFFINTLVITANWIATAERKMSGDDGTIISPDLRGTCKRSVSPSTVEWKNAVKEHILSFQKKPKSLSVAKMYRFYVKLMNEKPEQKVATLRQYRTIFSSEFILSFFFGLWSK
jgi:hypothetical protein